MRTLLVVAGLSLALAACGYKGALYLPKVPAKTPAAAPAKTDASAPAANSGALTPPAAR
ncbi:hypothetical protein CEK28_01705 [Xenophilus sp. AP218F]|nr:lipoprotein [Chromobacterium sp. ASV5]OWY41011.1 hypothetical protein CEK28_01705 [Xenophilus sp. AP218F]